MSSQAAKPTILCVDDEPHILEGLTHHLRRVYEVLTASSGEKGLGVLAERPDVAVVMSDMRMPIMNGAEFLRRVRVMLPDAVRLLLTGQSDFNSAVAAVNEGQIFRFLAKPCPPDQLLAAVKAAADQHQLITAERVLLEQTLRGSIKALVDILALTNPVAFGRANRVKTLALALGANTGVSDLWQLEVAALLSQLGAITLSPQTAEKLYYGKSLSTEEQQLVDNLPTVVSKLLGNIPRLDPVLAILNQHTAPSPSHIAGHILHLSQAYDQLEVRGYSPTRIVEILQQPPKRYPPAVLQALSDHCQTLLTQQEIIEIPIRHVQVGMMFVDDVLMCSGAVFVSRGYEVTASFVERVKNVQDGVLREPVQVKQLQRRVPI